MSGQALGIPIILDLILIFDKDIEINPHGYLCWSWWWWDNWWINTHKVTHTNTHAECFGDSSDNCWPKPNCLAFEWFHTVHRFSLPRLALRYYSSNQQIYSNRWAIAIHFTSHCVELTYIHHPLRSIYIIQYHSQGVRSRQDTQVLNRKYNGNVLRACMTLSLSAMCNLPRAWQNDKRLQHTILAGQLIRMPQLLLWCMSSSLQSGCDKHNVQLYSANLGGFNATHLCYPF